MADASEFVLGGLAACCSCLFTNPLEFVKVRLQLQGELRSRGHYTVHYKNVFHAFYKIAATEGLTALQKGIVPALYYQFFMSGVRLGVFQSIDNLGLTRNNKGEVIFGRTVLAGALAGCCGALVGSPFYLIKTHLQAKASSVIAVGHQHPHESFSKAFVNIVKGEGIKGLWRGSSASLVRVTCTGASQLTAFTKIGALLDKYTVLKRESRLNTLASSIAGGLATSILMTPLDVVSTRLYNQPVDKVTKKGLKYNNILDCMWKMFKTEGIRGFYKGGFAYIFRVGPHTVLTLTFWRELRKLYFSLQHSDKGEKPVIAQTRS